MIFGKNIRFYKNKQFQYQRLKFKHIKTDIDSNGPKTNTNPTYQSYSIIRRKCTINMDIIILFLHTILPYYYIDLQIS